MAVSITRMCRSAVVVSAIGSALLLAGRARAASERVVYAFAGNNDAAAPESGLVQVGGAFYGTSWRGGTAADGTVFSVSPDGSESVVYSFKGGTDGDGPIGGLINVGGVLYGTTEQGGSTDCGINGGCGTVFSVTPSGSEAVLHAFDGANDGSLPYVGLLSLNGVFYGVAIQGGQFSAGTAFSLQGNVFSVLHTFKGGPGDGNAPRSDLINIGNTLYGTTYSGGVDETGTLYSLTTQGTETVLHSFMEKKDGYFPFGRLTLFDNGIYGTTPFGRNIKEGTGTIFRFKPGGTLHTVYRFPLDGSTGNYPNGGLIDVNGVLYGTTYDGGAFGHGTVFSLTRSRVETVLYSFKGGSDGDGPNDSLVYANGVLYGTTVEGGGSGCQGVGCGTVFAVTP